MNRLSPLRTLLTLLLAAALVLGLASCSDSDDDASTDDTSESAGAPSDDDDAGDDDTGDDDAGDGECGAEDDGAGDLDGNNLTDTEISVDDASCARVEKWQVALAEVGCWDGDIDGTLTAETAAAVETYEDANGLEADGVLDPNTESAIQGHQALGQTDACAA